MTCRSERPQSGFMRRNLPLLCNRFCFSYLKEESCIEYFINNFDSTETVSSALIFSYNFRKKDLHVSRFHPELSFLTNSKYLSAACFYLLIHHFAGIYGLDNTSHISLETVETTSSRFYRKLGDFDFTVSRHGVGEVVELVSTVSFSSVDTSMVREHICQPGEIPFLK
ncbi:MAG: hypothetical protein R6V54_13795 [Desulfobacteraceae bacterium]